MDPCTEDIPPGLMLELDIPEYASSPTLWINDSRSDRPRSTESRTIQRVGRDNDRSGCGDESVPFCQ
jgi:hypothetical protein